MVFQAGPCEPWSIAECAPWPDTISQDLKDEAVMAATEILWEETKKQFGTCTYTLRPCALDCADSLALNWLYGSWMPQWGMAGGGWGWPYPALVGGVWLNIGCGTCQNTCSCNVLQQIELPYPVSGIGEVKVDGDVLDPSAYRVDDWRYLVRLDGGTWPRCNDLNKPDTEDGTWSVTGTYGEEPPAAAGFAVNELALTIAKNCIAACNPNSGTVAQIDRQGVRKKFVEGQELFGPMALRFIKTWNPTQSGIASIINLDRPPARRVGT